MERSIWRQGRKIVRGMQSEGSVNFGIIRNYAERAEVCEVVRRVGNRVAEYRFKYFCLDYVSKFGVSVTERNIWGSCSLSPTSTWGAQDKHILVCIGLQVCELFLCHLCLGQHHQTVGETFGTGAKA